MAQKIYVIDDKLETSRKAMGYYVTGFVLSLFLTVASYFFVTKQVLSREILVVAVVTLGFFQLLVQVIFFLHLPAKSKPYWNLIVFFFTLLIVSFLVIGSLWIMYNLNYNMMGVSPFNSNEGYIPQ